MARQGKRVIRQLNNKGLTLVEVMISITIFSIMIVPIITQMNTLLKSNSRAKVSQAETDYATRVMEQFKEGDSSVVDLLTDEDGDPLEDSGTSYGATQAGYYVDKSQSDDGKYIYYLDNVKLEKDLDSSETSVTTGDTTYSVEVELDASAYDESNVTVASADGISYTDPNSTDYYNLQNLDDRYCVMVRDTNANYDTKAEEDIVDKIAAQLKEEFPSRYNQWLNGANVLNGITYSKKTYVKISYDSTKKAYYATVILSYTSSKPYVQTVSYVLMNNKEYSEEVLGKKAPKVYIFYSQFAQENQIIQDSDEIIIDNEGLANSSGTIPKSRKLSCYLIKSDIDRGEYTYYRRYNKDEQELAGDEYLDASTPTNNTASSNVYVVESKGSKSYMWPSFVVDGDYYDSHPNLNTLLNAEPGYSVNVTEDGETKLKYVYNNVLVPSSVEGAVPSSVLYEENVGDGYLSYRVKNEGTTYPGRTDEVAQGSIIYQKSAAEYVWPDGSTTTTPPDLKSGNFSICTPSKLTFDSTAGIILATTSSNQTAADGDRAIKIYTNLSEGIFTNPKNGSEVVSTGTELSATGAALTVNTLKFEAFKKSDENPDYYVLHGLMDDKDAERNRLYQITLTLYKVEGGTKTAAATFDGTTQAYQVTGGTKKKVMSLQSGKEG
jgi:prepilin-type N-terminal cleavage/methylation domain-containing protein